MTEIVYSGFVTALMAARGGTNYPEPCAKLLRITEYVIKKSNNNEIAWEVYHEAFVTLRDAWSRLKDDMCIQERFDL